MADPKGDYSETLTVDAPAGEVFDFIADVRNMPKYLPTTKQAEDAGPERVHVEGKAQGHEYKSDGYLRADREALRMEWGADEGYYKGSMELDEQGGGKTQITVRIGLHGKPPNAPEGDENSPDPADVQEGLRKGLESIKNHVEGRGGKVEPAAAG